MNKEKTLIRVCGVDCHPGDENCNNYCNYDHSRPAPKHAKLYTVIEENQKPIEGSESYWKKRCLAAEAVIYHGQPDIIEPFETEWRKLKSSIGEETEGQDG